MEFRLLGPLEVVDGGTTVRVGGLRQRTLLGVLLLHRGRVVPLERLVDAVWDTDPPSSARDQVRNSVWALRKALGDAAGRVVVTEDAGYRLDTDGHVVDADRFADGVREARTRAERGDLDQASALLRTALGWWRGPALAGLRARLVRDMATGLDERRLLALEDRLELDLALGRHGEVVGELTEIVGEHPGRTRVVGQLMRALHGAGRSADALTGYQRARRHLADELGLDPPAELRELEAAILRDDPEPAPPRPALQAAEASRTRGRAVPRTLPYDVPDFTGRPVELERLVALGAGARTVVISTVEGMAGVGKTALAVHAAHALADRFPDGQLFVDLNGFTPDRVPTSPEDALAVLLSSLGVPRDRIPPSVDERVAMWRTEVADRRLLLVLDNAADAKQVAPLIPGGPGCLVLVTSRRRLTNLDGSVPVELGVLPEREAVALVVAILGAARVDDEPEAVAELVGLCGHLPLAIRIVSAHLQRRPRWTVRSLTERMAGEKRTLTALAAAADHGVTTAFALSYRALAPDQRRVFRLLGLHPGVDVDPYAAAALAGLDVDVAEAVLDQLADEYLLQQTGPGRYTFHDLLRAHARACAEDEEPATARHEALTRLFDHYRHAAAEAVNLLDPHDRDRRPRTEDPGGPLPFGHDVAAARAWLDRETPNLLSTAAQDGRHSHTCDLSLILWRHLEQQARHREAEALHTHAVASARAAADPLAEAGATRNLGRTQWYLGDLARAERLLERALGLFDHSANPLLTVTVLNDLATTVFQLGRHDEAIDHCERALAICAGTHDPTGEMQVLMTLGNGESLRGDDEASSRYLHQALRLAHDVGNRNIEARARLNIGDMYAGTGFPDTARTYLEHALELYREIGNREGEAAALANLGSVHTRLGDERRAARYLDQALAFFQQNGDRRWQSVALREIGTLHARAGRHEQADRHYGEALDLVRQIGNRSAEAEILDRLRENALARSTRATE
ncbi:AfsR/SARP family transcriptional regulator [Saccharothrix luteola]|uniref:AfsR/SARP family transcriptional regulator n=1 Tax=Saccharothrix luteola TaxID=2893018 RepID=UPI001E285A09|nr:BTAD domain-containing putative transcriptional regulator [Saccharothrix luteola]MCC8245556.1 tetratricopeptide repeat protein [Saccharothrix luteola]